MNIIYKTLCGLMAMFCAQTASAQKIQLPRLAMEGVDIVGQVYYGQYDSYTAMVKGYYSFSYENQYQGHLGTPLRASELVSGGCCYHDGKIYACEYDDGYRLGEQKPYWRIFDGKTFEQLYERQLNSNYELTTLSMAYDPTTDKIFAINRTYLETYIISIDPATGTPTRISATDLDNNYRYECIGCDKKGNLYMIYMETVNKDQDNADKWYLARVRKTDGKLSLVGEINYTPYFEGDYLNNDTRKQSLFYNNQTGKMYWMFPNSGYAIPTAYTTIAEVNTTTAQVKEVAFDQKTVLVAGAFFREPMDKAPAIVEDFQWTETTNNKQQGYISFKLPATAYDGTALTGELNIVIKEGDKVLVRDKAEAGTEYKTTKLGFSNAEHTISVYVSNEAGDGPTIKRTFYVGYDIPKACTNIKLVNEGLKTILTWDGPTEGVNGSEIDLTKLNYKVIRYPYGVTVAEGLKECRFEETHPKDMTRYVYYVVPNNGEVDGTGAFSNNLIVGEPLNVPYGGMFTGPEDMVNYYTILDENNDQVSWVYNTVNNAAIYKFNPEQDADDWLISPPINYKKGHTYNLHFKAYSLDGDYPESMEVCWGSDKVPNHLQNNCLAYMEAVPTQPTDGENEFNYQFTVPEDGVYYYGFHCFSPAYHFTLVLYDISVSDNDATGVNDINDDVNASKEVFRTNANGQFIKQPQKGVNIVRMANGETRKVVVK